MIDCISMGILPKPHDKTGEWAAQRDPKVRGERLQLYALNREKYCLKLKAQRDARKRKLDTIFRALDAA